jgi:hypothetical protein
VNSLSYIIDASNISKSDVKKLEKILDERDDNHSNIEFFLYNADPALSRTFFKSRYLQAFSRPLNGSLRDAATSASGDLLVFTPLENIFTLHITIENVLRDIPHFAAVAASSHTSPQAKLTCFRYIRKCPFIAFNKMFYIDNIGHDKKITELLKLADRQLLLNVIPTPPTDGVSYIIMSLGLVRPYHIIARKKIAVTHTHIRQQIAKRKAEKLRKNVPNVKYHPDIPVFIITRDRVEPLKKLVKWLEDERMSNIIFIDNASTYKPLLEYLKATKHRVVWLNKNAGHTSPWSEGVIKSYARDLPFIVTDPDVIPDKESHGAIEHFCDLLTKYPERVKVGFGLKIDDLPDQYELKDHVLSWESQFWESKIEPDVYDAEIDTTFAVYRQNTPYTHGPGLRTGGKYVARHEPWYINSKEPGAEIIYYRAHADGDIGSWGTNLNEISPVYKKYRSSKKA